MSKLEIMAELPRLNPHGSRADSESPLAVEEAAGPTESERAALDKAQAGCEAEPAAESSWDEVEARLHRREVACCT